MLKHYTNTKDRPMSYKESGLGWELINIKAVKSIESLLSGILKNLFNNRK